VSTSTTEASASAARSLACRLSMHGRIGRHGCHQPGRGRADVCTLRCSGELAQVFEIVLGDLAEGLTRMRPERHHQLPQFADAVDCPEHAQLLRTHRFACGSLRRGRSVIPVTSAWCSAPCNLRDSPIAVQHLCNWRRFRGRRFRFCANGDRVCRLMFNRAAHGSRRRGRDCRDSAVFSRGVRDTARFDGRTFGRLRYDPSSRELLDQNTLHPHALGMGGQQRRLLFRERSQQPRNVDLGHAIIDVGGN
jgi:hypothetical protein